MDNTNGETVAGGSNAAHSAVMNATATEGKIELLGKDIIKKDQDGIRKSLVKLDMSIHANAVQCLLHAKENGDTSLMRRLLVDIIDAKSGYRRQGLIAWMREFSPMELHGDVIKLTGMANGERKPFRIEEANKTAFTSLAGAREFVGERPVFRDNITSAVERAVKQYKAAVENTVVEPGQPAKPKDPTKPFLSALHMDKLEDGFAKIEGIVNDLNAIPDATKEVYDAQQQLKKAEMANEAAKADA